MSWEFLNRKSILKGSSTSPVFIILHQVMDYGVNMKVNNLSKNGSIIYNFVVDYILIYKTLPSEKLTLQPSVNEVKCVKWVSMDELKDMFKNAGKY